LVRTLGIEIPMGHEGHAKINPATVSGRRRRRQHPFRDRCAGLKVERSADPQRDRREHGDAQADAPLADLSDVA
jgi:hypothetical protein